MAETREELENKVQTILDRERWQGYVGGKIEGALNYRLNNESLFLNKYSWEATVARLCNARKTGVI